MLWIYTIAVSAVGIAAISAGYFGARMKDLDSGLGGGISVPEATLLAVVVIGTTLAAGVPWVARRLIRTRREFEEGVG